MNKLGIFSNILPLLTMTWSKAKTEHLFESDDYSGVLKSMQQMLNIPSISLIKSGLPVLATIDSLALTEEDIGISAPQYNTLILTRQNGKEERLDLTSVLPRIKPYSIKAYGGDPMKALTQGNPDKILAVMKDIYGDDVIAWSIPDERNGEKTTTESVIKEAAHSIPLYFAILSDRDQFEVAVIEMGWDTLEDFEGKTGITAEELMPIAYKVDPDNISDFAEIYSYKDIDKDINVLEIINGKVFTSNIVSYVSDYQYNESSCQFNSLFAALLTELYHVDKFDKDSLLFEKTKTGNITMNKEQIKSLFDSFEKKDKDYLLQLFPNSNPDYVDAMILESTAAIDGIDDTTLDALFPNIDKNYLNRIRTKQVASKTLSSK